MSKWKTFALFGKGQISTKEDWQRVVKKQLAACGSVHKSTGEVVEMIKKFHLFHQGPDGIPAFDFFIGGNAQTTLGEWAEENDIDLSLE